MRTLRLAIFVCGLITPMTSLVLDEDGGFLHSLDESVAVVENEQSIQRQSPWWAAVQIYHFAPVFATEVKHNFFEQLQNSPAENVLMFFYEPWSPQCQKFAPEFERVALATMKYNHQPTAKAETILTATIDCLRFQQICAKFGVDRFPSVKFGKRRGWIEKGLNKHTDDGHFFADVEIREIDMSSFGDISGETADHVASQLRSRYMIELDVNQFGLDDMQKLSKMKMTPTTKEEQAQSPQKVWSGPDVWDLQLATAMFLRDIAQRHRFSEEAHSSSTIMANGVNVTLAPKQVFTDFLGVLATRFPLIQNDDQPSYCRDSLGKLSSLYRDHWDSLTEKTEEDNKDFMVGGDEAWPDFNKLSTDEYNKWMDRAQGTSSIWQINIEKVEKSWHMCGHVWDKFKDGWHQCKGTFPGKRGYTCGLWNIFHFLAGQSTDETALSDLQKVRSAVEHFFASPDCKTRYMQLPVPDADIKWTSRDAKLWWWNVHNTVNQRVKKNEEDANDGDLAYPKAQWPTPVECPLCRRSSDSLAPAKPVIDTVKAVGSLSSSSSAASTMDVPMESVEIEEAIEREGWDIDEVVKFLDRQFGGNSVAQSSLRGSSVRPSVRKVDTLSAFTGTLGIA